MPETDQAQHTARRVAKAEPPLGVAAGAEQLVLPDQRASLCAPDPLDHAGAESCGVAAGAVRRDAAPPGAVAPGRPERPEWCPAPVPAAAFV